VVGGVIAVVGACFLGFRIPGSQSLLHGPLWLYLLPLSMVPAGLVTEYWWAILRGMNWISLLNVVEVGTKAASLVMILGLVWWVRLDVAGAVWADFVVSLGAVALMIVLLWYVGVWGRPSFNWALWHRTWRFALPAHCGNVMAYLNYRADQLIIAAFLPPEQLGFYAIAVGLAERLWIITGSVANALLPHLTNLPQRDPSLVALIARHVMLWSGAACLLVFALADVVVRLIYSPAFTESVGPLRWLLPGIFTSTIGKVLVAELLARERVHFTVWMGGIAAPVNIAANLVLVPRMGILGASLASSISYSLLSFMMIWYYLRETGVSWTALVPRPSDLAFYAALWSRPLKATPTIGVSPRGARL
jgi:O-antigen/teichoic acid export membrane protein